MDVVSNWEGDFDKFCRLVKKGSLKVVRGIDGVRRKSYDSIKGGLTGLGAGGVGGLMLGGYLFGPVGLVVGAVVGKYPKETIGSFGRVLGSAFESLAEKRLRDYLGKEFLSYTNELKGIQDGKMRRRDIGLSYYEYKNIEEKLKTRDNFPSHRDILNQAKVEYVMKELEKSVVSEEDIRNYFSLSLKEGEFKSLGKERVEQGERPYSLEELVRLIGAELRTNNLEGSGRNDLDNDPSKDLNDGNQKNRADDTEKLEKRNERLKGVVEGYKTKYKGLEKELEDGGGGNISSDRDSYKRYFSGQMGIDLEKVTDEDIKNYVVRDLSDGGYETARKEIIDRLKKRDKLYEDFEISPDEVFKYIDHQRKQENKGFISKLFSKIGGLVSYNHNDGLPILRRKSPEDVSITLEKRLERRNERKRRVEESNLSKQKNKELAREAKVAHKLGVSGDRVPVEFVQYDVGDKKRWATFDEDGKVIYGNLSRNQAGDLVSRMREEGLEFNQDLEGNGKMNRYLDDQAFDELLIKMGRLTGGVSFDDLKGLREVYTVNESPDKFIVVESNDRKYGVRRKAVIDKISEIVSKSEDGSVRNRLGVEKAIELEHGSIIDINSIDKIIEIGEDDSKEYKLLCGDRESFTTTDERRIDLIKQLSDRATPLEKEKFS